MPSQSLTSSSRKNFLVTLTIQLSVLQMNLNLRVSAKGASPNIGAAYRSVKVNEAAAGNRWNSPIVVATWP